MRCSKRSSSDSASFSPDLSLRNPLRALDTPADWMARIRPGLLLWLERDIRRCLPAKPLTDELVLLVETHWVA